MKARYQLTPRTIGGVECPYPGLALQVRDRFGTLATLPFRIDLGAGVSAIPLSTANKEGIAFQKTYKSIAVGMVGATIKYRDRIRVLIAGKEHLWPCDFIVVPPPVRWFGAQAAITRS